MGASLRDYTKAAAFIAAVVLFCGCASTTGPAKPIVAYTNASASCREQAVSLGTVFEYTVNCTQKEGGGGQEVAIRPLFYQTQSAHPPSTFWALLYPLVTYRRYGAETRFQAMQLFSYASGDGMSSQTNETLTLFPFIFSRTCSDPAQSYFAFWPIAGSLKERFYWEKVTFILWPLYVRTERRGVKTYNFFVPLFHYREGAGITGWQFWPVVGTQTWRLNGESREESRQGRSCFVLWPLFSWQLDESDGHKGRKVAIVPFFAEEQSDERSSRSFLWPIGLTITSNKALELKQIDLLWPLVRFTTGVSNRTVRLWPLYSDSWSSSSHSRQLLWPIFMERTVCNNDMTSATRRVGLVFWIDKRETLKSGEVRQSRSALWPLGLSESLQDGTQRFQLFAPVEPLIGSNETVRRIYSPLWALCRSERNPTSGYQMISLLWNLFKFERSSAGQGISLLFGLIQLETNQAGSNLRLFFVPVANVRHKLEEQK